MLHWRAGTSLVPQLGARCDRCDRCARRSLPRALGARHGASGAQLRCQRWRSAHTRLHTQCTAHIGRVGVAGFGGHGSDGPPRGSLGCSACMRCGARHARCPRARGPSGPSRLWLGAPLRCSAHRGSRGVAMERHSCGGVRRERRAARRATPGPLPAAYVRPGSTPPPAPMPRQQSRANAAPAMPRQQCRASKAAPRPEYALRR